MESTAHLTARQERHKDVALYIDYENLYISLRSTVGKNPGFDVIMDKAREWGRVTQAKAYADWSEFARVVTGQMFSSGVEPIYVPTRKFYDAKTRSQATKNSVDIHITIDIIKDLLTSKNIDVFVLVSGDRDFVPLMNQIRAAGKEVYAIGVAGCTSSELAVAVDEMFYYHQLLESDEDLAAEQRDIYAKLVRAIETARIRNYRPTLGVVKPILRELVGGFDERNFRNSKGVPFQKFKEFAQEAERQGFIKLIDSGGSVELGLVGAGRKTQAEERRVAAEGARGGGQARGDQARGDGDSDEGNGASGSARRRGRRGGRRRRRTGDGEGAEAEARDAAESSPESSPESSDESSQESTGEEADTGRDQIDAATDDDGDEPSRPRTRRRGGRRGGRRTAASTTEEDSSDGVEAARAADEDEEGSSAPDEGDETVTAAPSRPSRKRQARSGPQAGDESTTEEADGDGGSDVMDVDLPEHAYDDLRAMLETFGDRAPSQRRLIARLKKGAESGELEGDYEEGQFLLLVRKAIEEGKVERVSKGFYSGLRWADESAEAAAAS